MNRILQTLCLAITALTFVTEAKAGYYYYDGRVYREEGPVGRAASDVGEGIADVGRGVGNAISDIF